VGITQYPVSMQDECKKEEEGESKRDKKSKYGEYRRLYVCSRQQNVQKEEFYSPNTFHMFRGQTHGRLKFEKC
jgi:hypothetical protein